MAGKNIDLRVSETIAQLCSGSAQSTKLANQTKVEQQLLAELNQLLKYPPWMEEIGLWT